MYIKTQNIQTYKNQSEERFYYMLRAYNSSVPILLSRNIIPSKRVHKKSYGDYSNNFLLKEP